MTGMHKGNDLSATEQLRQLISSQIAVSPSQISLHLCPTGKFNTTYFVEIAGSHSQLVLRVAPPDDRSQMLFYEHRMMRQEPFLHRLITSATDIPVPIIHCFRPKAPFIGRDCLLMSRLPGSPLSSQPRLPRRRLEALFGKVGECLKMIHSLHHHSYGYIRFAEDGSPLVDDYQPMNPQTEWVSAFVVMWNCLLDDIVRCDGYSAEEANFMRRLLDRHIKCFHRKVPASLLHMDVWAQNILTDAAGNLTGLLDWDRALWGDPEIEFAVLDYCGISEPAFWEGYGAERDTSPEAAIRRAFYLLYEIQKYIFIRRVRGRNPAEADRYRQHSLRMAQMLV